MDKFCSRCNVLLDLDNQIKDKLSKNGIYSLCKKCKNETKRKHYHNNIEKCRKRNREYLKKRRKTDKLYQLKDTISSYIYYSFKNISCNKNKKTIDILCCSIIDFKKYIENKFEPWMNCENYGKYNGEFNYGWDLDHIIPISTAKSEEDVIKLNHYTNFQPLCSKVNRYIKKNKIN